MNQLTVRPVFARRQSGMSRRKAWLLGTASALVLGATVAAPALAYDDFPETYNTGSGGPTAVGYSTILANPTNNAVTLSATIANGIGGVTGAGTSAITTANSYIATAGGNDVTNTISGTTLPLPNAATPSIDGVAALGESDNTDLVATARVANSYLVQEIPAATASTAGPVSNNTMSASVTLNNSSTTVQGNIPAAYTSVNSGYAGTNNYFNADTYYQYYASGSVLATTVQTNAGSGELAGSGAMVTENYLGQEVTGADNTADHLSGSPAVTGNAMAAAFTGNNATTNLTIGAGGAPTFDGSAAVVNAQLNSFDAGAGNNPAAIVKYSYIGITLQSGSGGGASVDLTGAAAVTGNAITATAIGNQAFGSSGGVTTGNVLTLAGGIGLLGPDGDVNTQAYFTDGEPVTLAEATAVVNNTQVNYQAPLDSEIKQSAIVAGITAIDGGNLAVSSNATTAKTIGNQAYNAILAPGLGADASGAALNGTFALNSQQANISSPLTATIYQTVTGVVAGPIGGSTVTVDSNTLTASAVGNSVANAINLNSSALLSWTGDQASTNAARSGGDNFSAYGDVMLNSLQSNDAGSPVTAIVTQPVVGVLGGEEEGISGSTLAVTNNSSAALATGNAASNSLVLNAATISTSAALLGAQSSYGAVTATLVSPITGIGNLNATAGSALSVAGNLQRAIATGNDASNTLTATGSTIQVSNEEGPASTFIYAPDQTFPFYSGGSTDPQTYAGFVATNDQATTAPVTASVTSTAPSMVLGVGSPGVTNSTLDNSTNAIVAAARGSQATTQLTLSPTNSLTLYLGDDDNGYVFSPFATAANVQQLTDGTNVTASVLYTGEGPTMLPILTEVTSGGIAGSTLTMTANQIQALAQGNNATTTLTLSNAGTVAEPVPALVSPVLPQGLLVPPLSGDPSTATVTADEAFVVHNMQYAGTGSVTASQDGTGVQASITGDVLGSTVQIGGSTAALGNVIASTAVANTAASTLDLAAANLSASAGLLNFQISNGATSATMGEPGTAPTAGPPVSSGSPGTPGLVISLDGNVTNSTLAIAQNQITAASTANGATNIVSSTSAISSSALTFPSEPYPIFTGQGASYTPNSPTYGTVVLADLGLSNNQTLGAAGSSTATANGSFWIGNTATAPVYSGSVLSIDGNTQQANATGNLATNSVSLSPGITAADMPSVTASLLSVQTVSSSAETPVSASSNMLIGAPLALTGSTLNISGNTNTASAVANDVSNMLTVTGTTSLPGSENLQQIGYTQAQYPGVYAYADYSVVNAQTISSGLIQSAATTTLLNNDLYADPAAISNSSVTVDSNTTLSQALANRASNTLTVTAAGPIGTTATIANSQINGASVSASATVNATIALGQASGDQVGSTSSGSSFAVTNNTTKALATGNQVSNVMNISPTAYGTTTAQSGSNVNAGGSPQISTTYSVLNAQDNAGAVSAVVNGVSPALLPKTINPGQGGYVVALNTTGSGNSVTISGNAATSQAIGNRASNAVTLAALNTGTASVGLNSVQHNSGAISAAVDNVQVGTAVGQGTTGRVANNQLTASAFGNIVANSIITR